MRTIRLPTAAGVLALTPATSLACPVCFAGSSEHVLATYVLTAALMTALPLAIVGGFAVWLWRRFRAAAAPESPQSSQA
jgi:hypothetical protein